MIDPEVIKEEAKKHFRDPNTKCTRTCDQLTNTQNIL